ncbi:Ubiquitin-conjugating enzyme family protein [Euphorbia peplus]|nr:Ubiquitin-conjugating enzyme family protein [Euphorbia peplus]
MSLSLSSDTQQEINEASDFPKFHFVSDPSDHFYVQTTFKNTVGQGLQKKIMKEWQILQEHLPDNSIYVRAYEDRIDLMRAVIIGAMGTPYHDSLFFFDIAFPTSYPSQPPKVCYRSFGFRINPNLYKEGKVCLSLLNTWHGARREVWNPSKSTILQVLVSIQGLVLNEKPFFNEPAYNRLMGQPGMAIKSDEYTENIFILCCKTTLLHLRTPFKHFEVFIAKHFEDRRNTILSACIAYSNGEVRIGHYNSKLSGPAKVSPEFKSSVEKLIIELCVAFTKNEASLRTLMEIFKKEVKTAPLLVPVVVEEKSKDRHAKGILGKLKKLLHI